MLLSSFILSRVAAHVSSQDLAFESFKAQEYTQSSGTFCSLPHFKACALARPGDIVGTNEDMAVPVVCGSAETYASVPLWEF